MTHVSPLLYVSPDVSQAKVQVRPPNGDTMTDMTDVLGGTSCTRARARTRTSGLKLFIGLDVSSSPIGGLTCGKTRFSMCHEVSFIRHLSPSRPGGARALASGRRVTRVLAAPGAGGAPSCGRWSTGEREWLCRDGSQLDPVNDQGFQGAEPPGKGEVGPSSAVELLIFTRARHAAPPARRTGGLPVSSGRWGPTTHQDRPAVRLADRRLQPDTQTDAPRVLDPTLGASLHVQDPFGVDPRRAASWPPPSA